MYKIEGFDWVRYIPDRDQALRVCRQLNSIPAGQLNAGTYSIERVTDPAELALAQEQLAKRSRGPLLKRRTANDSGQA